MTEPGLSFYGGAPLRVAEADSADEEAENAEEARQRIADVCSFRIFSSYAKIILFSRAAAGPTVERRLRRPAARARPELRQQQKPQPTLDARSRKIQFFFVHIN
jgi:hypothetical protein